MSRPPPQLKTLRVRAEEMQMMDLSRLDLGTFLDAVEAALTVHG